MCVCRGIYICIGVVVYNVVCSCCCIQIGVFMYPIFSCDTYHARPLKLLLYTLPKKQNYYILSRPGKVLPCKRLLPHWSHTIACRPKHKASEMDTSRDRGLQLRPQRFKLRLANTLRLQLTHEAPPQFFVHTYGAGIGHRLRQYVT